MSVMAAAVIGTGVVGAVQANKAQKQSNSQFNAQHELAREAQAAQLGLSQQQQNIANEYNDYNKSVFRPLETQLVSEAQQAGSPGEIDRIGGEAAAGVRSAFGKSREASGRSLARMGINPASGRALAVRANDDALEAVSAAAASNTARDQAKTVAYGKRMDAASLGRNLPSAQAVAANGAIAGANGAAATGVGMMNAGINQSRVSASLQQDGMSNLAGAAGMALRYGTMGGTTPLQTINRQFTTTNAPWSASAAFDNPAGM